MSYMVAVTSSTGEAIDLHFGAARSILILSVNEEDGSYEVVENRILSQDLLSDINDDMTDGSGCHCANRNVVDKLVLLLDGCRYLLTAKIGNKPGRYLQLKGITSLEVRLPVDVAIEKLNKYHLKQNKFKKGNTYENLKNSHPCFGGGQNSHGRIHLPVSPGCNIQCKFCERIISDTENRPGVTSEILTPQEALETLRRAIKICPQISVAGIAGPGDTLATDYAFETFRLIKKEFPDMIKCMSTNGLLLNERAEEIISVGIDSLTVTVNAVNPQIEAKLNGSIVYHGDRIEGEEGAKILIRNQLAGIKRLSKAGITIKVNTVLVPGINDDHIEVIAKTVHEAGASIYNIIPLIPQHELADIVAPTCEQVDSARTKASKYIDVFRHCQRCRADAAGLIGGKDIGDQIYQKRILAKENFSHG